MHTSRRSLIVGAAAASLLAPAAPALAIVPDHYQTLMRRVMGLGWYGQARIRADQFVGGQFVSTMGMKFNLNPDWSFDGLMLETVRLEGGQFDAKSSIWGDCWVIADKAGLTISRMRLIEGDRLPQPYSWGSSTGTFRFYNDSDRSGHFTLQGTLRDDQDGTVIEVQLSDMD